MSDNTATLVKLSDTGQTVADPAEDIRGRTVLDSDGKDVGNVHDLLIDEQEHKVRLLRVEHGGILGFGAIASFIPVDAISRITLDTVYLNQPGKHVAGAPGYDPDLKDQLGDLINMYGYYGYTPFWGPGYMYPGYPYYK
jgi:sporulation protein YlmC with PRC-barrel domain